MRINNRIDYTLPLNSITNVGIEYPSPIIMVFLKKHPFLGKNIQYLIDKTNEARVINLIWWLNRANKLANILDNSNLEQLASIIKQWNSSFIIKNFLKHSTNTIIEYVNQWKLVPIFHKTRSFFNNAINSIISTNTNQEQIQQVEQVQQETLEIIQETVIQEKQTLNNNPIITDNLIHNEIQAEKINYTIKNFQNRFKWIEGNLQLLIKHTTEEKITRLISSLTFTSIRLADVIKNCDLIKFAKILNNNNLAKIISDIKMNKTEDIIYAIKYWKMPWIITKAKLSFKKSILSFLEIPTNNNVLTQN